MRLLRQTSEVDYSFAHFETDECPPYAIFSHAWGMSEEEVSYDDIVDDKKDKSGYGKLQFLLAQAARDGIQYVWLDTCCIDKRNSSELSEAINSMFRWFKNATVCYALLTDASADTLERSRWFMRGWTLQELVAPSKLPFFGADYQLIGEREHLASRISTITGIEEQVLRTGHLDHVPFATRFSWSRGRHTRRVEDEAYCLLGLLDVCMPPLYGEGAERARNRLFREVDFQHGKSIGDSLRASVRIYGTASVNDKKQMRIKEVDENLTDQVLLEYEVPWELEMSYQDRTFMAETITTTHADSGCYTVSTKPVVQDTDNGSQIRDDHDDESSAHTDSYSIDVPPQAKEYLMDIMITELTERLPIALDASSASEDSMAPALSEALKTFSILLRNLGTSQPEIDAGTFVRKYRNPISKYLLRRLAMELRAQDPELDEVKKGRTNAWIYADIAAQEDCQSSGVDNTLKGIDDMEDDPDWSHFEVHRTALLNSIAYPWLMAQLISILQGLTLDERSTAIRRRLVDASSREEHCRISDVIIYQGSADSCYATTTLDYVSSRWGETGMSVLSTIDRFVENTGMLTGNILDAGIRLLDENGSLLVHLTGGIDDVLDVGEILVWISTACQVSPESTTAAYCTSEMECQGSRGDCTMHITFKHDVFTQSPTLDGDPGLCWLNMVRNPVIARGYPIPSRSTARSGLELSWPLLLALSQVTWSTTFASCLILKGLFTALVLISVGEGEVVWHFKLEEDGTRLTYHKACEDATADILTVTDVNALRQRRHFVGTWFTDGSFAAGTGQQGLYPLEQSSSSRVIERELTFQCGTLTAGKYLTAAMQFKLQKKDVAVALDCEGELPFMIAMDRASDTRVLFYGSQDGRGWLMDGASAVLHLGRAWISSACAKGDVGINPDLLRRWRDPERHGGPESALRALVKNMHIPTGLTFSHEVKFEDSDQDKSSQDLGHGSGRDSAYVSQSAAQEGRSWSARRTSGQALSKSTGLLWEMEHTFRSLWHSIERLSDAVNPDSRELAGLPLGLRNLPFTAPHLIGWEAARLLKIGGRAEPMSINLDKNAAHWVHHMKTAEPRPVVLFARTFGEMIYLSSTGDAQDHCPRTMAMPLHKGLLAVPLHLWSQETRAWLDEQANLDGPIRLMSGDYWHSFDPDPDECTCDEDGPCDIFSSIGERSKHVPVRIGAQRRQLRRSVFERCPNGVALLGRPQNHDPDKPRMSKFLNKIKKGYHTRQPGPIESSTPVLAVRQLRLSREQGEQSGRIGAPVVSTRTDSTNIHHPNVGIIKAPTKRYAGSVDSSEDTEVMPHFDTTSKVDFGVAAAADAFLAAHTSHNTLYAQRYSRRVDRND